MNTASLDFIRQLVARRSAIMLDAGKGYLVQARLLPLAKSLGIRVSIELVVELQKHPDGHLADQIVDAMTTNETSFFRDTVPFDALRDDIIPQLLQARASSRRLSIWCAACATGQEPYSIAMLLREHFRSLRDWDIRILASDISHTALAQATEGRYGEVEIRRGLPPALRDKYFRCTGTDLVDCRRDSLDGVVSTDQSHRRLAAAAQDGHCAAAERHGVLRDGNETSHPGTRARTALHGRVSVPGWGGNHAAAG